MKKLTLLGVLVALTACAPAQPDIAPVMYAQAPVMDVSQHFRVMPLGDSITTGYNSTSGNGYRALLLNHIKVTGNYTNVTMVGSMSSSVGAHEGHPGWTIVSMINSIDSWMASGNPDLVYLEAGVNDVGKGYAPEVIAGNMKILLDKILAHSPTVRVIVGDLMIPNNSIAMDRQSVTAQRYNALLPQVVANAGPRVSLAYMSRVVAGLLLSDKVHPGDVGYERMAWVWWRCTGPLLSEDGIIPIARDPLPMPMRLEEMCS